MKNDTQLIIDVFSKLDVGLLFNSINSDLSINNEKLSQVFFEKIVDEKLKSNFQQGCLIRSLFNCLGESLEKMLMINGDVPVCGFYRYQEWNTLAQYFGDDLLVVNKLALLDKDDKQVNFTWDPIVLTDNERLKSIFQSGLAELHYHVYGSLLMPDLNWLAAMRHINQKDSNKETVEFEKEMSNVEKEEVKVNLILLAGYIRICLYKSINKGVIANVLYGDLLDIIKGDLTRCTEIKKECQKQIDQILNGEKKLLDYAMSEIDTQNQLEFLTGERKLLYKCLKKIYVSATDDVFGVVFLMYILIRLRFRLHFVLVGEKNFEAFATIDGRKVCYINKHENSYMQALHSSSVVIPRNLQNNHYLELRLRAKNNIEGLQNSVNKFVNVTNNNNTTFIIHFIKEHKENENYRERIINEAKSIIEIQRTGAIVGVDAAGNERDVRPEVFGPVYRKLKKSGIKRTYHVGEYFYDIVDGLRAIDEVLIFLNLESGDRLGHSVVLGLEAETFYNEKKFTIELPRQILIDNLAWLLYKIESLSINVKKSIKEELVEQYHRVCDTIFKEEIEYKTYINSWLLRGDDFKLYEKDSLKMPNEEFDLNYKKEVVEARKDKKAIKWHYRYSRNVYKKNGIEMGKWTISEKNRDAFINLLNDIQLNMGKELQKNEVAIECNPTSNIRICPIGDYSKHPIVKFNNDGLKSNKLGEWEGINIPVSINTDNAGIFATSLEKEFTLIALALENERDEKGEIVYDKESIYTWLEKIRSNAFSQKFANYL